MNVLDYRVIVGIDFGTTYSGFAYTHKKSKNNEIFIHTEWQGCAGQFKTPTVLLYGDNFNVLSWGFPALVKRPKRKKVADKRPVELFKLHLGKMSDKPILPSGLDYKKAITDYLREFGKVIKDTILAHWTVDFFTQVLLVFTIPAEFDDNAILIMRECAFKAGLLRNQYSRNLKFTTEPEAATIYCMKSLKEHGLSVSAYFMVVECGKYTVDLTTRQLLEGEQLGEITERSGSYCGDSFVDQEFLKFLEHKVGASAIKAVKENHYCQLQFMVQEFCRMVKKRFTGVESEFEETELELNELCPVVTWYCNGEYQDRMKEEEWSIKLKFDDVKKMFDPIIEKIKQLINSQLCLDNGICSALILTGEFSESKYLQSRIKQEFNTRVKHIHIPPYPATAIMKGAVQYGLDYDEIQESNNHINKYKSLYNNLQEKYDDLTNKNDEEVQKLKNDIKRIEEQHLRNFQQLENQIIDNNIQYQSRIELQEQKEKAFQDEIQESNNNLNKYKLLCNNLQEKYDDLTKKNNEEIQKLKNDIKEIEEQHLKDIQQLENQVSNNQQYQNKIKLQEQIIDQLQQSLKLKGSQLQNSEKEKEELNTENGSLYQKTANLTNQLENLIQQNTLLENEIPSYQLDDVNIINLNNDISELNNNLLKYITDLKQDIIVNVEKVENLLSLYKCPTRILNQKDDRLFIQAILQRHIIETIFSYANQYFRSTGQDYHLESDIINKAHSLSILLTNISNNRDGNSEITEMTYTATTKFRQQIYSILNSCGFADIFGEDNVTYEHPFIVYYKEQLNIIMNELRIVKNGQKKATCENLAATIIREAIKIFWFKLKIQEPVVQYVWIPHNVKVNETFMEGNNFNNHDNENLYVELCYFPLTGNFTSGNQKIYTLAKVFIQQIKDH